MACIIGIVNKECWPSLGLTDSELTSSLSNSADLCHVLEFRSDTFDSEDMFACLKRLRKNLKPTQKLLFTLRMERDGGACVKSPLEREQIWTKVIEHQLADWLDIEIEEIDQCTSSFLSLLRQSKTKMLLSHHCFSGSYSFQDFNLRIKKMESYFPDILKMVVTLRSEEEFGSLMKVSQGLAKAHPLSCCISMGEYGVASRLGSPLIGAPLTYGYLGEKPVVSGQLSVTELDKHFKALVQMTELNKSSQKMYRNLSAYLKREEVTL